MKRVERIWKLLAKWWQTGNKSFEKNKETKDYDLSTRILVLEKLIKDRRLSSIASDF